MKKINVENLNIFLFVKKSLIHKIKQYVKKDDFEKAGYLFIKKIKNTNEYICSKMTEPHKRDKSTFTWVKISLTHKLISLKIQRQNKFLQQVGFFHTHPNFYNSKMSNHDFKEFTKKSKKHLISFFIIATNKNISFYIFSYGKIVKEIHE